MNKQVVIGIVAVVVLVGGYFIYTKMNNGSNDYTAVQNPYMKDGTSAPLESTNPNGKKMAFDVFVKQGGSYVCSVNQSMNGVDSKGTFYVSAGKMRGEFDTTVQGTKMTSSMIMKDDFMYTWSSASPNSGFKMAINGQGEMGTAVPYNPSQIGDYNCEAWTPDESKFNPPSTIKFTSLVQ